MQIQIDERRVESLEREQAQLIVDLEKLCSTENDAISKVSLLEKRVDEREREIEAMMDQNNKQRSNTVQVLKSLLPTERAARGEAINRAEALSLQFQATQAKLDGLQQELTSVRLNDTTLESKLKTAQGKHSRIDDPGTESVHDVIDMDVDEEARRGRKRTKSMTSPLKVTRSEDGDSVFEGSSQGEPRNRI